MQGCILSPQSILVKTPNTSKARNQRNFDPLPRYHRARDKLRVGTRRKEAAKASILCQEVNTGARNKIPSHGKASFMHNSCVPEASAIFLRSSDLSLHGSAPAESIGKAGDIEKTPKMDHRTWVVRGDLLPKKDYQRPRLG